MAAERDGPVQFVLVAEAGILEAQAVLLCESIRRFAGRYASCPITVVSPRPARRPTDAGLRRFEQLAADYLALDVASAFPHYGTSYRVHALAHVERLPGPPVLVQLDSDTVFLAEPDLTLDQVDAAARPVDVKGMCTSGPGDPLEDYWQRLGRLVGVACTRLPIIETTVDRVAVRASYNGGLVAARRECGIFQRTEAFFRRLVAARMSPWPEPPVLDTGTGRLRGNATTYWGTSQAALSLAAAAGGHTVRLLPATHNFPLHLRAHLTWQPRELAHIHYHGLFANDAGAASALADIGVGLLPHGRLEWLSARLPLHSAAEAGQGAPA